MKDVRWTLHVGDGAPTARLLYGTDVLSGLRMLPEKSVHVVATSPPYWGLRDYGTAPVVWEGDTSCPHDWAIYNVLRDTGSYQLNPVAKDDPQASLPEEPHICRHCGAWKGQLGQEPTQEMFVHHLVLVFREVRRVLRDDGTLWMNLGDSFSGSGRGAWNAPEERRAAVKESYVPAGKPPKMVTGLAPKNLLGIPWRAALALQADGWVLRNDIIWQKGNPLPSAVLDRFTCTHEHLFLFAKSPKYFFNLDAVRTPPVVGSRKGKNPGDHLFTKEEGLDSLPLEYRVRALRERIRDLESALAEYQDPGDVMHLCTQPFTGSHFAVWPQSIPERCIAAGSSSDGCCADCGAPILQEGPCSCGATERTRSVVLDPFSGSGTTGRVALRMHRDYVGVDLNEEYLTLARARLLDEPLPEAPLSESNEGSVFELFDGDFNE